MGHLTPIGDPVLSNSRNISSKLSNGNVVAINVCGLKCKFSLLRCIIFQILLKMGPLTRILNPRGDPF